MEQAFNLWYIEKQLKHEQYIHTIKKVLVDADTAFQKAQIFDLYLLGVTLFLDGELQSAELDEFMYHEALVHPGALLVENVEKVLILGGGEGATLREVLKYPTVKKAVMIDIDKEVVELCKKYLPQWSQGAFEDPRSQVIYTDARKWIMEENTEKFDVIIHDLTQPVPDSPSRKLFSKEFFTKIKETLTPKGVLGIQASRSDFNWIELHACIYRTLKEVFKIVRPYDAQIPSFANNWGFITASDAVDPLKYTPQEIDELISQRIKGNLKFYDGITHQKMFSLTKIARTLLEKDWEVITDEQVKKGKMAEYLPKEEVKV